MFLTGLIASWTTFSGTAHAQVGVSEGGMPGYSHVIGVPPGIAGMAPQLSLNYAGGGVNGPVGLGWSVQGLSTITRCPASKAIDGKMGAVVYGPDDRLCLDGQRLIRTDAAGAPLLNAAGFPVANDAMGQGASAYLEFRTEKDTYARIRAYGYASGDTSGSSGPAYFKLWTKSGQIYEYGDSPSSDSNTNALARAQGKTVAMAWAVARISDTLGNLIDFKYTQNDQAVWGSGPTANTPTPGHEWNIAEIQYSGNKVLFNYITRSVDGSETYHRGSKNVSTQLLQSITTYVNAANTAGLGVVQGTAVAVKTIKLTYDNGSNSKRARLTRIQECAGDPTSTRCLPATSLSYANGGNEAYQSQSAFAASALATLPMQSLAGDVGVIVADFDGDGRSDIIRWSDDPTQNRLYLSNGDGTFRLVPNGQLAGQFNIDKNLYKSDGCYQVFVGDFNGDGLPDILRYASSTGPNGAVCNYPADNTTFLYRNNGDGSFTKLSISGTASLSRTVSKATHDCIAMAGGTCVEYGTKRGWTLGETFFLLDIDGDGKLDLVTTILPGQQPSDTPTDPCVGIVCTHVYKGDGQGGFVEFSPATNVANHTFYAPPSAGYSLGQPTNIVDLNGDRLADILNVGNPYLQATGSWISLGDGNFVAADTYPCPRPIDFNGDGRSDCLWIDTTTTAANSLRVSTGAGTLPLVAGFNVTGAGNELAPITTGPGSGVGMQVVDINGDGRQDILRWEDNATKTVVYLSNGDGTFTPSASFNLNTSTFQLMNSDGTAAFVVGDFTGHGTTEFLRLMSSPTAGNGSNQLYVKSDFTPPDQLISATTASGATSTLYYVPLSNPLPLNGISGSYGLRYTSDRASANAATGNVIDVAFPMWVVATKLADSGVGSRKIATEYSYAGLKADLTGRGLLGFRQVLQQTLGPDGSRRTVVTQYLQTHPYIGVASRSSTYLGALNATASSLLLSTTANIYCDQSPGSGTAASATVSAPCPVTSKVQRPFLANSVEQGWDLGGSALPVVTTDNTFDGSGNPLVVKVTTALPGSADSFIKTTTNQYFPDDAACSDFRTCNWVLARLSQTSVRSQVPSTLPATTAGTAPNASATQGSGPVQAAVLTSDLAFAGVNVGTSSTLAATLANDGAGPLSLTVPSGASVTGTDFSFVSTTCPATLAAGTNCTVNVKFAPTANVARTGSLTIASGVGDLHSALTGTGLQGIANLSPTSLAFATTQQGQSSAASSVTLTNTGNRTLTVSSVAASANFGVASNTCTSVPINGSCSMSVMFTPSTSGTLTGTLTVSHDGGGASSVPLSGVGQAPSGTLGAIAFGAVTVSGSGTAATTLTNTGVGPLTLTVPSASSVSGAGFSFVSTTCTSSLPSGGTCSVTVQFAPTAVTSYSGTLSVATSAGTLSSSLSGSGTQPSVVYQPQSTNWGVVGVASDSGDWPVIKNNSNVNVTITAHSTVSGPAGMWSWQGQAGGTYCQTGVTVLAPGASCQTFFGIGAVGTTGAYSAVDQITYSAGSASFTVQQSYSFSVGTSTASTASLAFGNVAYSGSAQQSFTITNNATNGGSLKSLVFSFSGANATKFTQANTCGTALAASASCTVTVTFAPGYIANGFAANLQVTGGYSRMEAGADSGYTPYPSAVVMNVALSGNGYGAAPTLTTAASQSTPAVWYYSAAQSVTLSYRNDGNQPMTLGNPSVAAPLSVASNGCSNIAAGSSCNIGITVASNVAGLNQSQVVTPTSNGYAASGTTVTWTTYAAVPRWSTTSLAFGNVTVNTSSTQNITLYNDGNVAYNWAANNTIAGQPVGFSFDTSACASVAPSGSCTVVVAFRPTTIGANYSGSGITMAAASYVTNSLSVSGTGVGSIATLTSASTSQTFATVAQGNPAPSASWTFRNDGNAPLSLTLGALNSPFVLSANNCSNVAPGISCAITAQMSTSTVGNFSQSGIGISGAAQGNRADLSLSGTVVSANTTLTGSPTTLSFGTVNKSAYKDLVLTLTNTGTLSATGLTYTFGGSYAAFYSRVGGTCPAAGGSIGAGASCTITIEYSAGCTQLVRNGTFTTAGANFSAVVTTLNAATGSSGTCN